MFRLNTQTRKLPAFKRISAMATTSPQASGPIESAIRTKLVSSLQPTILVIHNDSYQHRHHASMRAQGGGNGETHFSLEIVSDEFKGKVCSLQPPLSFASKYWTNISFTLFQTTMQRHRMIYSVLSEELNQGLHSLSLKTKTKSEAGTEPAST
ncbi:hypothetical protein J3R30DRAFT_1743700 [Lentinula aciculospora]|uniref:Bola-like protein n=1 Tax=Lentinula aciculospora TaxID=153920 RepID=A0A9W9AJX2_9AGAR|nr:hypothetical protein J3R30DRAFT_1743700 [Lentinula aciculospora]